VILVLFMTSGIQVSADATSVRVDEVRILKPAVSNKDKTTISRRVYPAEVYILWTISLEYILTHLFSAVSVSRHTGAE
jgi:hypothetical protein